MKISNNKMSRNIICLAIDIERSGGLEKHDTIGIGASVVDQDFNELDRLFLRGYFPKKTVFESRCWDEFWSKHEDKLNILEYDGPLNKSDRELDMITQLQSFRAKWEKKAKEDGAEYYLVSDNSAFDGAFINQMIFEHLPNEMPIPYTAFDHKYSTFFETHSQQKGLLFSIDPRFKSNWGLTKRIGELYKVPEMKVQHDHRPDNDAYTIAFEQQVLFGIRDGIICRKSYVWECFSFAPSFASFVLSFVPTMVGDEC